MSEIQHLIVSILNVVKKMSTSLHAVFNVGFGIVYFNIVIFIIHGQKIRFSESSENSITAKSIFGHFEVIFLNV